MDITDPNIEAVIQERMRLRRIARSGAKTNNNLPAISLPEEQDDTPAQHYLFEKVLACLKLKKNTYLVGPAGSGKSWVTEDIATQLNLPFYCPPVGRETTNAQLFGYFNADGFYVRTPIREALEHGGVLHLEEIDWSSPAVGTALNALLANRKVGFPDAVVPRHPDFIIIASANTFGTGATATYIGSQGLNAATLDRFVFLPFPYDEKMERKIAPNKEWCKHVQAIRARANTLQLKHVISPRATISGGDLLNSQMFTWDEVEAMVLFRDLDTLTIAKLKGQTN